MIVVINGQPRSGSTLAFNIARTLAERSQGHSRYGQKTIMERLRWESKVRTGRDDAYKISNTKKDKAGARYARMLISEDPSFDTFFETRQLTGGKR